MHRLKGWNAKASTVPSHAAVDLQFEFRHGLLPVPDRKYGDFQHSGFGSGFDSCSGSDSGSGSGSSSLMQIFDQCLETTAVQSCGIGYRHMDDHAEGILSTTLSLDCT